MSTIKIKRTTGSSAPTGLTFGEPAYVQGLKSLYMGQTAGDPAIRIGAEVDTNTSLGSSDNKLPTQLAVKTYVDNAVAGAGTNTFNQIAVSGQDGLTADAASDVLTFAAGTGIALTTTAASDIVTFTNVGVQSLAGTSNQITVSGSTGAVTLSLPSTVTVPGALNVTTNLTVTGNLTVNGTTTTVNSDTMTVDDPVIILGTSGGVPIAATDGGKDRGIAFNYFDTAGRTGFFGYDASANEFVFMNRATVTNDVATGLTFGNVRVGSSLILQPNAGSTNTITASASAGNRTYTLSAFNNGSGGGELVAFSGTYPTATGYILRSNAALGDPTAPSWIDPSAAGFTAYASTRLATARTIGITGDIDGTATSFDGTANINISAQIAAGSIVNADINGSAAIVDTKLDIISTPDKVSLSALNIDGGTDIGAALADADLIIVDDGGGGTNRKSAVTRIYEYVFGKVSGDITINSSGVAAIGSGVIVNADINASAAIVDTKLDTISTANKVSLTALNIDGGEETTTIVGSDLLIVDDGANGTNRKVTVNNLFGANSTATVDGGSY
jgi:serine acetyltransferase/lipopolysaccharide export system protein LptA